ncbi:MAG: endonuclease/exonuclease/phosphatase family protein [Pseudomonadota bacterium]
MLRAKFAGAFALMALLLVVMAALAGSAPTASPVGPIARILDSLTPWMLALSLCFSLLAFGFGARWFAGALATLSLAIGGWGYLEHRRLSLPALPDAQIDTRVMFFNVFYENRAFSDRIVTEILAHEPDVVVIAEAEAMQPSLGRLRENFAFVSECTNDNCELIIASKTVPIRSWKLRLNPVWQERYAVAELRASDGRPYFLSVAHLAKPWLSGVAEPELARVGAQFDWLPGPAVVVGDFNAAPWSLPIRELLHQTRFKGLRWPLGTWPARFGRFGVPIDQVLVHEGARVVSIAPVGAGLNSNHRGFVVDIALP